MSAQKILLEATLALNGNKKKEKLGALENLCNLLNQEEVVESLHRNSKLKENSTVSWNILFIRVHNAVLSLVNENIPKNRQIFEKHLQLIQSVILQVVQKSIFQKNFLLDCNLLASSLLAAFESDCRIKFLGSTYLNIFVKYVLNKRKNWCNLKEEYWIGIKNLCKNNIAKPAPGTHSTLYLEILIDIIRHSTKVCQISHNFVDLFDFVREIFLSQKKSGSSFELVLLRFTNTLCLQLAVEYRYKVCEFTESVFDTVMNMHELKNVEKKILLIHFLMTTVNIHNPSGCWDDKCSYASNLNKWKSQVKEIFFLCHEEVKLLLKNTSEIEIELDFLELFVDVSHLVHLCDFKSCLEVRDNDVLFGDPGPTNKRKCFSDVKATALDKASFTRNKQIKLDKKLSNLVKDLFTSDSWFWLKFLELQLHKYPSDIKDDYYHLVEILYQLICDKRDLKNTKASHRCLCALLEAESSLNLKLTSSQGEKLSDIWKKIFVELIRSFHTEVSTETHLLIRTLISHSKIIDPSPLIKLYCNGKLLPDFDNFQTLCMVSQNIILPEVLINESRFISNTQNCENVRALLLLWLLQGEEEYPCRDLAKALIALVLKRFEEEIQIFGKETILISRININDFCKLITNNYRTVAFENIKFLQNPGPAENNFKCRIDDSMKNKLFELLAIRGNCLVEILNNENLSFTEHFKAVKSTLWFCELLCYLLSHFENMGSTKDIDILSSELESVLYLSSTKCLNLIKKRVFDLSSFTKLYDTQFHQNVQKKIRDPNFINLNFLKTIFELFSNGDKENDGLVFQEKDDVITNSRFSQLIKNAESVLHFQNLTKKEKLIINAVEFLCQYVTIPGVTESNRYQSALGMKITNHLIHDMDLNIDSNFQIQLILRVVYTFTKYNGISVTILNSLLDLMQLIFDSKPKDSEVLITILQVFKDITYLVNLVGDLDTHSKFLKITNTFRDSTLVKSSCGIKVVLKFIEFLTEIANVDLNGTWAVYEKNGSFVKVVEEVLEFLKNSYHEIRLMAAQNVGFLFKCSKTATTSLRIWQKRTLKNLYKILNSNSEHRSKHESSVTEYFDYVNSSVSLVSWASVICLSSFWRKKALFYLIRTAFDKQCQNSKVEDILSFICKELKIINVKHYISVNLFYLFHKWIKKQFQIQDFPFYLLGCTTVDDFIQDHYQVLVVAYSNLGRLEMINLISAKINKPVLQVIKECHSVLMSFILPGLSENAHCEVARKVQKLKQFIDQQMSSKISIQYLTENLDKVIYNLIRNMHDPEYLKTLCEFKGNVKDDESPLGYNTSQIIEALENLSTNEGKPLLGKIAVEVPAMIETVLLLFLGDMETAVFYSEKVFAFYKYIFFVETISKVTHKEVEYQSINTFIIRDVVSSVAAVIKKDEGEDLTSMACECFYKMAEFFLKGFSKVFGKFLRAITTVLILPARKHNKKALKVLNYLICDNYKTLENEITSLDSFPSDQLFAKMNLNIQRTRSSSLKSTIKHFLRAGNDKDSGCRIEGLISLKAMLSKEKDELKDMYNELKNFRGFSEDCKKSLLHQLICTLVEMTFDKNADVKNEAANCLGELGPSDLTTLVLRPENNFITSKEPALNKLIKSSVNVLSDFLVSDNYNVKKAASKALHAVLSTRLGKEIIDGKSLAIEHLTPFLSSEGSFQIQIKANIFLNKLNNPQLWEPFHHHEWIVLLLESILQSLSDSQGVVNAFIQLIRVNWQFAEIMFPAVLDFVFSLNEQNCLQVLNTNINAFFEKKFSFKNKSLKCLNKTSVHCMVNVVDYIRIQRNNEEKKFELNINYLHVAKAALYCSAYFTSIFYAELWFEEEKNKNNSLTDINVLCELFPEEGFALTEILRECHAKIGNSDGIHGCGYMHILEPDFEIQHYEHLKNWGLSMLHHDIQLSQGNVSSTIGLLNSLERFGMFYTLNSLIKSNESDIDMTGIQYKCAARLQDWSQLDASEARGSLDSYNKCYYFALKAFHDEDYHTFQNEIYKARKCVLSELAHCSLESSKNLYQPISELQCLKELEEFARLVQKSNKLDLENLFEKWNKQDCIKCNDFELVESILTNRIIIIKDRLLKTDDIDMKNYLQLLLCEFFYKLTVAARKEKKFEAAIRTLNYLNNVNPLPQEIAGKIKLEKSRILWGRGDKEIGRFLLNHFLKNNEISGELKTKSLRIYGDWMAQTKSENSLEIIKNYYLKSIVQSNDSENKIDSYASLAKFADSNYEQLNEYFSSPQFEIKQNLVSTQQDMASELRQELGWNQNRDKRMAYQIVTKQSVIDENEIKNSIKERDSYLIMALKYYLLTLKEGEKYNLVVFRVISLWLSNSSNLDVIQQLQKTLSHIPSYKFLCLLPQLVPRMADVCLISDLVEKILKDHPHHTLPFVFALNNSYEDLKYSGEKTTISTPRVLAAKSMLEKFKKIKSFEHFIGEMEKFTSALIELANYNPVDKGTPGSAIKFPEDLKIKHIFDLKSVSVPSLHIPYNKNCVYNVIGVHKFEESYYLVGGVNLPKRVRCIGIDGISRTLLVKGKDDLRQDAVMQQVFTIMNSLLSQNCETNKRKLIIRTYKVVPLSQRSGVIEWCENTQPLSLYLTGPDGKSGAHKKYHPNDTVALDCRCIIRKVFAQPQVTNEDKLRVFLDVCKQIQPVFHHFFIENFPVAGVWFERRLAYIHSVATSSMIGYILGIGDRHVHNILIDNMTAEVIHIDLGIAFEQGKTLLTPETVPFRLTRDIVDGMGLSGIEGDFRISCVKTMEVLRENKDTILTLLEVLLYDPLYTWTITPEKAYFIQNHRENSSTTTDKSSPDLETNKMAERALIRLKQKLQGIETGCVATNVEGQVHYLIQQARDPNNLCRLFHGWQAYL